MRSHTKKSLLLCIIGPLLALFSFPAVAIDLEEVAKLLASDAASGDQFGVSVAIDGDTAVIGAQDDDDAGNSSGSAYVFTRSGTTWSAQAKLTASDAAAFDNFGRSVDIDGDTVVIGAAGDDDAGSSSGSAYVFTGSGTVWSEQAKLTASDAAASDLFGFSVAIDGDTAVIGNVLDDDGGSNSGSAYVFTRSGTAWSEQPKLTASDAASRDQFGVSVAIDGDTAVIGANGDDDAGSFSGSAYVFTRTGTAWSEQAKLTASDAAARDQFGYSVAIDGDTAVFGAYGAGSSSGSAYVFTRSGTVWSEQAKLTASDAAASDLFGFSVAIDGDTAVFGAYGDDDAGALSGSAYVFTRTGATWSEQPKLTASDAAAVDLFGYSVAIDGDTAVIGAIADDDGGSSSGSAYVFELAGNQLPIANAGGPYTGDEGSAINIDAGASSDPDGDPLTYSWAADSVNCTFDDATSATTTVTCADNGSFELTLTVSDGTDSAISTATLIVDNVAPSVTITAPLEGAVIPITTAVGVVATVSDPGTGDTHACSVDWGDTTTSSPACDTSSGLTASHLYPEAGVYTIQVTATDNDGGTTTQTVMIVVYDPSAGFVTGGGWINSAAGAYKPDPTLTGKANFGFVSKYKKGAATPTGTTQFVFQSGDLKFHSDTYQWLVVNQGGANAQYKGTGTINGELDANGNSYGFMLWAGDGDNTNVGAPDTFRIRIWSEIGGLETDVYDNGTGQPIDGGSVVIHTGGKGKN